MKFAESKAKLAEYLKPAIEPQKPINPDFVSLGELLMRVSIAHNLSLTESANFVGHNLFGTGDAPAWIANGKQGIHPLDAVQKECAIRRLEYVFHRGQFECDGPDSGASTDYEIFGFDRSEFSKFLTEKVGEPMDLLGPMPDTAPAQAPAPVADAVDTASDGPAPKQKNKSPKTLEFEAKVIELMYKFWNERTAGTKPTKSDLCKQVYQEILRTNVRGARQTTESMVRDAAKPWKFPLVLPVMVSDSKFNDKRHPFKGDK